MCRLRESVPGHFAGNKTKQELRSSQKKKIAATATTRITLPGGVLRTKPM
jgi:hypothetical protein